MQVPDRDSLYPTYKGATRARQEHGKDAARTHDPKTNVDTLDQLRYIEGAVEVVGWVEPTMSAGTLIVPAAHRGT